MDANGWFWVGFHCILQDSGTGMKKPNFCIHNNLELSKISYKFLTGLSNSGIIPCFLCNLVHRRHFARELLIPPRFSSTWNSMLVLRGGLLVSMVSSPWKNFC